MKKLIVFAGGAVVAASASMALFGAGVAAAAPDVVGQTYADASAAIEDEGGSPKVAVSVGGTLEQDDCIVTNAWDAPFVRDDDGSFAHAEDEVMLALNCAGGFATATKPGASLASTAGREAKAAAEEAAAEEEQELAEAATPDE
ncbi:hypothetical protein [Mycobacterium hubeiense]|uniref:hypothetical protein n=1 Tax=Mycobacterium hubeiense TaxID=1867256 RepID=UPI001E2B9365|nr:hypothetical protein [Mycobacterium sp. QGD 101]